MKNPYNLTKEQLKEIYIKKLTKEVMNEIAGSNESIDEISFRGLGNIAKSIGNKAAEAGKSVVDKVGDKAKEIGKAVADKATEAGKSVEREYDKGVMSDLEVKVAKQLAKLADAITKHNQLAKKHGKQTINAQKYMGVFNKIPK